jgi:hypothetical protein
VIDRDTAVRVPFSHLSLHLLLSSLRLHINKAVDPKTHKIRDWNSDSLHKFCSLLACNSEAE